MSAVQVRGWRSVPARCSCRWSADYSRLPSVWSLMQQSEGCPVHDPGADGRYR